MPEKRRFFQKERGRSGGLASAAKLTPERLAEVARAAVQARWERKAATGQTAANVLNRFHRLMENELPDVARVFQLKRLIAPARLSDALKLYGRNWVESGTFMAGQIVGEALAEAALTRQNPAPSNESE